MIHKHRDPGDLKKLEYQDFKFDVPLHGFIIFEIIFTPDVLPEIFPHVRKRRTRIPKNALMTQENDASATASNEKVVAIEAASMATRGEAAQEATSFIISQNDAMAEMIENTASQEVNRESASMVEVQEAVEASLEINVEPESKETRLLIKHL